MDDMKVVVWGGEYYGGKGWRGGGYWVVGSVW